MIRVTLINNSFRKTFEFQKSVVTIGCNSSADIDLSAYAVDLSPSHLKILEENSRFYAINEANDPFATLNGMPFGKKALCSLDRFQLGNLILDFQAEAPLTAPPKEPEQNLNIGAELDDLEKINWKALENDLEQFDDAAEKEELKISQAALTEYHAEVAHESIAHLKNEQKVQVLSSKLPSSSSGKANPFFLGEFDDESEHWEKPSTSTKQERDDDLSNQWKMWGWFFVALVFLCSISAFAFYRNMDAKKVLDEAKAAETLSDVAMALKYAQLHHIKPPKQNWSDANFIRNSLASVLPNDSPILPNLDTQGRFINAPYILRTYTNADFSHFLVIAQPAPSLLQWLVPKNAIIVDSRDMELRKISDLKILNRILVNSNMLDNSNQSEISDLVKQGELIPLSNLKGQQTGRMFGPPKALMMIRPGAENVIYNAPRYYQMGESLMKHSIALVDDPTNIHELNRLKHEAHLLSKLPNLVLYSSQGISLAMEAQKALGLLSPETKFLTAYLTFNSKGKVFSSHLVMDAAEEWNPIASEETIFHNTSDPQPPVSEEEIAPPQQTLENKPSKETLIRERKETLIPLSEDIIALLRLHNANADPSFEERFNELMKKYLAVDKELQLKIEHFEDLPEHPLAESNPALEQNDIAIDDNELFDIIPFIDAEPVLQSYE